MKYIHKSSSFVAAAIAAMAFALGSTGALASEQEDAVAAAQQTLEAMKGADPSLGKTLKSAAGYAVFPNINKGGLGIAGAGGEGVLYVHGHATGTVKMSQVTVGLQAGGQSYSEVLLFANTATVTDFKNGQAKFSAGLSAVAASAGASLNAKYQNGIAVIIAHKGGLMGEVSVGGQKFDYKPFAGAPGT